MKSVYHIGMDVHKESTRIAVLKDGDPSPVYERTVGNDIPQILRILNEHKKKGKVSAAYEAGCMGYTLYRAAQEKGIDCRVLAPNKIVRAGNEKIKTDKRDAILIARMLKHGEGESIYIPTADDEAARDLLRCRHDLRDDLHRTRQRLTKFLLRQGYIYEKRYWTKIHNAWIRSIKLSNPLQKETFDQYLSHIEEIERRLARIEETIVETAESAPYKEKVNRLRCIKGIDYITALSIVCEVGDFRRFAKAGSFMAYLGLVPSEYSSGAKRKQGGITKTGNGNLRRLLVEAAWHYQWRATIGRGLEERRKGMGETTIAFADKAIHRLTTKFHKLTASGKSKKTAVAATARELAGFVWGMMMVVS